MILHTNLHKILGPPGTGKTTRLLSLTEMHLANTAPDRIAFLTFTRKAAYEARDRAMEKFDFKKEELPYFSTLHSLAFQFHKIDRRNVMSYLDYINLCHMLKITISSQILSDDGSFQVVHTKGDRLFFLENYSRTTKTSLKDVWSRYPNDDIIFEELQLLAATLREYKVIRKKVDFTDMISTFVYENISPAVDVFILDEAQDLSALQWDMASVIASKAEVVYIAGDDDQAIYTWAGADVKQFQSTPGNIEVLNQSYRLPKLIHMKAESVISKVKHRVTKQYNFKDSVGSVLYRSGLEGLDMTKGTWLLLARNIFLLSDFNQYCMQQGHVFESKYGSPINPNASVAIMNWELLRQGHDVPAGKAKIVYEFMSTKKKVTYGAKTRLAELEDVEPISITTLQTKYGLTTTDSWSKAFDKLKQYEIDYFMSALKRGESIFNTRIKVSTIHGVKGGEADNVVLVTDMSKRTFDDMNASVEGMDNERRVWYVGITRAKETLHILHPQTPYSMEI